jgi:hypothetical protein
MRNSGFGIVSFIISVVTGLGMFALIAASAVMQSKPGGMDEKSPVAIVLGLGMFALLGLDVVAAGLGIAGFFQKDRKRLFAVFGTIFSSLTIICTLILMVVGLMIKRG